MAENEYLDVRRSGRFTWLIREMLRQRSPQQVGQRLGRSIQQMVNKLIKNGFPFGAILDRAMAGLDMSDLVRGTGGRDLAHLIRQSAQPWSLPGNLLNDALTAAARQVLDSAGQELLQESGGPDVVACQHLISEVMNAASPGLEAIAERLAARPDTPMRVAKPPTTEAILSRSLIPLPSSVEYGVHP